MLFKSRQVTTVRSVKIFDPNGRESTTVGYVTCGATLAVPGLQKHEDIPEAFPDHDALLPRRVMRPREPISLDDPQPVHVGQIRLEPFPLVHRHELILGTLIQYNEPRCLAFSHPSGNFRGIEARRARRTGDVVKPVVPRGLEDGLKREARAGAVTRENVGLVGEAERTEQGEAITA